MKEQELREHAECSLCHELIGHTGLPLFWTVELTRHGINMQKVKQQDGLAAFLGGHVSLSQALGPDEDMTVELEHIQGTLCETCALENPLITALWGDTQQ